MGPMASGWTISTFQSFVLTGAPCQPILRSFLSYGGSHPHDCERRRTRAQVRPRTRGTPYPRMSKSDDRKRQRDRARDGDFHVSGWVNRAQLEDALFKVGALPPLSEPNDDLLRRALL